MSRAVQIKCPNCQNVLRVPIHLVDASVKCKHCNFILKLTRKVAAAPVVASPRASHVEERKAPVPSAPETKYCLFCGKLVPEAAETCEYCGAGPHTDAQHENAATVSTVLDMLELLRKAAQADNAATVATKNCPFCGCAVPATAKKCKHCGVYMGVSPEARNATADDGFFAAIGAYLRESPESGNTASHKPLQPGTRVCPFCAETIKVAAKKCKHCGEKVEPIKKGQPSPPQGNEILLRCVIFAALLIGVGLVSGSCRTGKDSEQASRKWYEGGTLHAKTALEWQVASHEDKLATCGDFVAGMWTKKKLVPRIQNAINSVDEMKPYAQELVDFLDAATRKHEDSDQNRKLYSNQDVAELAVVGMISMKWLVR